MSPAMSFMASPENGAEGAFYFQSGTSTSTWLPSQVVVHGHQDTKVYLVPVAPHFHRYNRYYYHDLMGGPACYGSRSLISPHCISKMRFGKNWAGGQRMHAVFLDSVPKSRRGTGVFLPQQETGTDLSLKKKKSASAPVLLPGRVIQALNLNVHALGVHISPKDHNRKRVRSGQDYTHDSVLSPRHKMSGIKNDEELCIISESETNSLPELCLPKEWTY